MARSCRGGAYRHADGHPSAVHLLVWGRLDECQLLLRTATGHMSLRHNSPSHVDRHADPADIADQHAHTYHQSSRSQALRSWHSSGSLGNNLYNWRPGVYFQLRQF